MNVYRRYHTISHVAVLLGMLTFCVADDMPGLGLFAIVATAGSWVLFRSSTVSPFSRWAINLLLLAATANMFRLALAAQGALQDEAIAILAQYLIYLQLIKLFETRTPRDQAQLLTLNVMLVLGAVLTSVTFQVGVMLMLYAPAFLSASLAFQLYAGQHRAVARRSRPAHDTPLLVSSAGRHAVAHLRAVSLLALALIAVAAAAIFVMMPRSIGDDFIGQWPRARSGTESGFSDAVRLGDSGIISESWDIVIEFDLVDQAGRRLNLDVNRYLRGTVLDEYDPATHTWNRSKVLSRLDKQRSNQLNAASRGKDSLPPSDSTVTQFIQNIHLRNKSTDHLFSLWEPAQVAADTQQTIYLNRADSTLRMVGRMPYLDYQVRSFPGGTPNTPAVVDPSDLPSRHRRAFLDPDDAPGWTSSAFRDTEVERYARNLIDDASLTVAPDGSSNLRILQIIERDLRSNFTYTLDTSVNAGANDPLDDFLTTTRAGHCEYFASAMAAMAQSIGIPARVVTGYVTNEIDPATGNYVVRRRHAHAWVEALVYTPKDVTIDAVADRTLRPVWKSFDPTPPSELDALNDHESGFVAWARRLFDRAEQVWVRGIVAFGSDEQETVLSRTGLASVDLNNVVDDLAVMPGRTIRLFLLILAIVASLAPLVLLARRLLANHAARLLGSWRSQIGDLLHTRDPRAAAARRSADVYNRALALLSRAGLHKPASLPPLAFATAIEGARPDAARDFASIVHFHYAVRFGERAPSDDDLRRVNADLDRLRHSLKEHNR